MKKYLLACFAAFNVLTVATFAQISIDSSDVGVIGDQVVYAHDSMPTSLPVGWDATGSQTWDFSTQFVIHWLDTTTFEVNDNPFYFPGANMVINDAGNKAYVELDGSSLDIVGYNGDPFGVGVPFILNFSDYMTVLEFPATNGTMWADTGTFTLWGSGADIGATGFVDSFKVAHYVYTDGSFDAYGDLETPGDTFVTIREYQTQETIDSLWLKAPILTGVPGWVFADNNLVQMMGLESNPVVDTMYYYNWYGQDSKLPVLQVETDIANNPLSVKFKVTNRLAGAFSSTQDPDCNGSCDGEGTAWPVSGVPPYNYLWSDGQTGQAATNLCGGVYDVTVTDNVGDVAFSTVAINEPIAVSASLIAITPSDSTNGEITITASGGSQPYSYMWSNGQNTATATGLAPGTYDVTVTDANGCIGSLTGTNVPVFTLEVYHNSSIKLYPNPAKSFITVSAESEVITSVSVYDLTGQVVINQRLNPVSNYQLELFELSQGIYLIEVVTESGKFTQRISKL